MLTDRLKSKVQTIEMKLLRRVEGVTKLVKIRNDTIRERLEVEPVANCIKNHQLRWFGHINRLPNERPAKVIRVVGLEEDQIVLICRGVRQKIYHVIK